MLPRSLAALGLEATFAFGVAALLGVECAHWGGSGHDTLLVAFGGAIAGGVIGNKCYAMLARSSHAVADFLATAEPGQLPLNHDLARAIRRAQLSALLVLAEQTLIYERAINDTADRSSFARIAEVECFRNAIRRWSRQQRRFSRHPFDIPSVRLLAHAPSELVPASSDQAGTPVSRTVWQRIGSEIIAELRQAGIGMVPPAFEAALCGHASGSVTNLHDALSSFFMEDVKIDVAVHRVLEIELLMELRRYGAVWCAPYLQSGLRAQMHLATVDEAI